MASSEQLEREAEATRARIAETLAELRMRIGPGQIAEQAFDYARDNGGGEFVRRLGRQIADNPLPVALTGAGIAWLMAAQRRDGGGGEPRTVETTSTNEWDRTAAMAKKTERTTRRAGDNAESAGGEVRQAGSQAYGHGRGIAESAYEAGAATASRAYDKASELAGSAYESASEVGTRAGATAAEAYDRAREAVERSAESAAHGTRGLAKFVRDEPLVLAGLGVALGALIGALLPMTKAENRAMGAASDQLKRDAREAVREQWEHGKAAAEDVRDKVMDAARRVADDVEAAARDTDAGGADGHGTDTAGAQASLVPSEEETKAAAKVQPNS